MVRSTARPKFATAAATVALMAALAGGAASAQQEWQPFKDKDERAARAKRAPDLPPPLPSVDRGVFDPRATQSTDGGDTSRGPVPFGAPYPGQSQNGGPGYPPAPYSPSPYSQGGRPGPSANTVERVELTPLDPLPGQSPPGQPQPGQASRTAADAAPAATPGVPGLLSTRSGLNGPASNSPPPAQALPADLWRGLDMPGLESLVAPLDIPPRSPALQALWRRVLTADATAPAGGKGPAHFTAFQLEALYRSAALDDMSKVLARSGQKTPLFAGFQMRRDLAVGDMAAACAGAKELIGKGREQAAALKGEANLVSGYCAAADGNTAAAGLAAELAREMEIDAPFALAALDAAASGVTDGKAKLPWPARLLVLDYKLASLSGPADPARVLGSAEPALLTALSEAKDADVRLRVAAAEAGVARNALSPLGLAAVYGDIKVPPAAANEPLFRRARLYQALAAENDAGRKAGLARQYLDDGRKTGLGWHLAASLASMSRLIAPSDAALEVAVAAGDAETVRRIAAQTQGLGHWLALADIIDPLTRGVGERSLAALEEAAQRGRFQSDALHRLATVLDALDVNIPVPLWEAASRTPQPTTGHLPKTGVLPQLHDAAKKRELGKTALLVLQAIGPNGPDGAHLIALGDSLRALRRTGLDTDARALALEALFASWPRGTGTAPPRQG